MDWQGRMNDVMEYIENNLEGEIDYGMFGQMLCCSTYEFSRVFSFVVGISISEYIKRRKLSRAATDIQKSREKIIDIAMRYGYESQTAFARAFKSLHGQTPLSARKDGVLLQAYPRISFALILKGVDKMNYRIEKKESFRLTGKKSTGCYEYWCEFDKKHLPRFMAENRIQAPFWYVGAYFLHRDENEACIIGTELKNNAAPAGMDTETIPAATWSVFPFVYRPGEDAAGETYAQVVTQWLSASGYTRREDVPYLEVYGHSAKQFEVWVPVLAQE